MPCSETRAPIELRAQNRKLIGFKDQGSGLRVSGLGFRILRLRV